MALIGDHLVDREGIMGNSMGNPERLRNPRGRNLPLSLPRRLICDVMHLARQVPSVPVQRHMNLAALVEARRQAEPRPSWCALFAKAYAFVAANRTELRRAYLSFPWPHLYEHPLSIVSIAFERQFQNEEAILFATLRQPDKLGLTEIDVKLKRYKEAPIERITPFRRALRIAAMPRLVRRFLWWIGLNVWGRKRAHYMGTCGLSVYGGLGASSLHPLTPLTTALNYGVIDHDGNVDVRIIYDHRVLDGPTVARALDDLERVLKCEILAELRYLKAVEAA